MRQRARKGWRCRADEKASGKGGKSAEGGDEDMGTTKGVEKVLAEIAVNRAAIDGLTQKVVALKASMEALQHPQKGTSWFG